MRLSRLAAVVMFAASVACAPEAAPTLEPELGDGLATSESELTCAAPPAWYTGNYPSDRKVNWAENVQGIGSDGNSWYLTQTETLWKVPLTQDLGASLPSTALRVGIPSHLRAYTTYVFTPTWPYRKMVTRGYNHFGDLDVWGGRVFVPLEGPNETPRLVVFRASDLAYLADVPLGAQNQAGWVAINPSDWSLYTSDNVINTSRPLKKYTIDWAALFNQNQLVLGGPQNITLLAGGGAPLVLEEFMQGGDFSDDGCTLFLVNGRASTSYASNGIHAITTASWTEAYRSNKSSGGFLYEWHSGYPNYQEPEGLTFTRLGWGAPGIYPSSLHVLLLGVEVGDDSVWLKHYQ